MSGILEKLFTWQYFEPVLFTSIGVLLLLLFIVLFLGKKDQKRKLEETKKLELSSLTEDNSVDAFAKEESPSVAVEIPKEKPVVVANEVSEHEQMNMETTEEVKVEPDFEIFANKEDTESQQADSSLDLDIPNFDDIQIPEVAVPMSNVSDSSIEVDEPVSVIKDDIELPDVADAMPVEENNNISEDNSPLPKIENDLPELDFDMPEPIPEMESPKEEPIKDPAPEVELTEKKIQEFRNNFADLASSINKELDEINKMHEETNSKEEVSLKKEIPEEIPLPEAVDVTPINEVAKFKPSAVFSSVHSPNEIKEEKSPVDLPLPKESISGPKGFEMPARKEDVELPEVSKEPVNVPDFSAFNDETFDIK